MTPQGARLAVLLVEDGAPDRRLVRELLADGGLAGAELHEAESLAAARALLEARTPDVALLDLGLPEATGLETFLRFQAAAPGVPTLVLTGFGDDELALECVSRGAEDYLVKGRVDADALARALRYAVERARHKRRLLEADARTRHLNRLLRTAFEVHQLIVAERDVERVLAEACRVLVEKGALRGARAYLAAGDGPGWRLAASAGESCPVAGEGSPSLEGALLEALGRGESRVVEHAPQSDSCLFLPLRASGALLGALAITRWRTEGSPEDVRELLEQLAGDLGFAIEAARREEERRLAEEEVRSLAAELERRVVERTAELEMRRQESEAFSYSVSHDLRAPLRAIDGFSAELEHSLEGRLGEEERHLIETVRANVKRMGRLIEDLLAFSRTGRQPLERRNVVTARLVEAVVRDVLPPAAERKAEVRLGPLPDAWADPALLRQVWENLLSNALKFSATREGPVVEVRGRVEGDAAVFEVADNGVGFDDRYAGKLFGVFQRLHGREFEGTGIGLALVRSIVVRHGGAVSASSSPGAGATFRFSLPFAEAARP